MNSNARLFVSIAGLGVALSFAHAQSAPDHFLFTQVLKDHVVQGAVDYPSIKNDKRFAQYLAMVSKTDPRSIENTPDRLAFWINAYNAFTIKLINDNFPVKSIRDIKRGETGPWDIIWVEIGGKKYSLNQIEHEIIRKEFEEPRIHVALVCAAVGCPPLRSEAYTGDQLDRQLEDNGRRFFRDPSKNRYDRESGTLYLSELLSWYGEDFSKRYGSAQHYALRMMGIPKAMPNAVRYLPYDWSLNSQ